MKCFSRGKYAASTLHMVGTGAAFLPLPLPPNIPAPSCASVGFTASFSFEIATLQWTGYFSPADGFTFSVVTTPAMGGGGNQLGYGGLSGLAVQFDSYPDDFDPPGPDKGGRDGNHVGINVGGSLTSVATSRVPVAPNALNDIRNVNRAKIQYDPTTQLLTILINMDDQSIFVPLLTRYIDLCSVLKLGSTNAAPTMYVGFTAGSSASRDAKYIIYDWEVSTAKPSVCLLACLPACLPAWLFHRLLVRLSVWSVGLSISRSVRPHIRPFVCRVILGYFCYEFPSYVHLFL